MQNKHIKLLVGLLGFACMSAMAGTASQHDWRFNSASQSVPDADGDAATIVTGPFASGWQDGSSPLAGVDGGFWDLGRGGNITCSFAGAITGIQQVTVRLTQWWDGGIYRDFAAVQIPGAPSTIQHPDTSALAPGGWVVDKITFTALPSGKLDQLTVTAGSSGALVSRVIVETSTAPIEPLVLSVRSADGLLELSWPEGAGNATVESSANLNDSHSWSAVQGQGQLVGGRYTLTVPANEAGRYFRLKR